MKFQLSLTLLLSAALLGACSLFPFGGETATSPAIESETLTPEVLPSIDEEEIGSTPITLNIWLPEEFSSGEDQFSWELFQAQLDAFAAHNPGIRINVRIKPAEGEFSMINSLLLTNQVAPLALPDLILFPTHQISTAVEENIIFAFDPYLSAETQEGWYDFAREIVAYEEQIFVLPIAADALIMAYRPSVIESSTTDWNELVQNGEILAFPASDPQGIVTLAFLASTNQWDSNQDITEVETVLTNLFFFYEQAAEADVMPFWLSQYDQDQQSWQAFVEHRAQICITWSTNVLNGGLESFQAAPLPSLSGTTTSLVRTWGLGLTTNDPNRAPAAAALAEFLLEDQFLGEWNLSSGYLPTRSGALAVWPEGAAQALGSQILPSAQNLPSQEVLSQIGPPLMENVVALLRDEINSQEALENFLAVLGTP